MIAHWDEVAPDGDLAQAAGAIAVSLRRIQLAPGNTVELPARETEDVLFVVSGGTDDLRAGDCVVYPVPHEQPTLRAGAEGLTALLFATPAQPAPFHDGTTAAPQTINVAEAEPDYEGDAGRWVRLARQAGAQHAGVNYGRLVGGQDGAQPHCHSADEELFVFLEGDATFELWPSPQSVLAGNAEKESLQIRAGHVISRPRARASRTRSQRARRGSPSWCTGRGDRTMSAITPGRTRSTGVVLASSHGWSL